MGGILSIIQTLVVLSLVIVLAHISLKLLNGYMIKQNKIIKIWEKTAVNTNSSLGIVEITGKYYLMSFAQGENKILKELDGQEIEEMLKEKEESMDIRENGIYKKIGSFIEERKKRNVLILILIVVMLFSSSTSFAAELGDLGIILGGDGDRAATVDTIRIFMVMTILTLAPSFLILTTSFTRIIVVLSFVRNAVGTQQAPPNQLLIGLALFLTFFIMRPVYTEVMDTSVTPFLEEEITREEAIDSATIPLKRFMLKETREKDIALFLRASNSPNVEEPMDLTMTTVVPAFAISELRTAFSMGFMLFVPFLVIDMVVASILMSMGMMMLPPVMISLPFKILLFVLVDGWHIVIKSLVESFI